MHIKFCKLACCSQIEVSSRLSFSLEKTQYFEKNLHKKAFTIAFVKFLVYNDKSYILGFCKGAIFMGVSYKKLFKLLIDRSMKKKDLQEAAGISPASVSKLAKDEYVSMEVVVKVCTALQVDIGDIMEIIPPKSDT